MAISSKCSVYLWIHFFVLTAHSYTLAENVDSDYCAGESFSPSCDISEVVVIERARYGRMRLGKCVAMDLGFLGCAEDVLPYVSRACSGRQSCNFLVVSQSVGAIEPCGELRSYLEVTYSCMPVVTVGRSLCTTAGPLLLSQPQGYISTAVARDRGCGSMKAPWRIEAEPGQSINVSLINYTPLQQDSGGRCQPLGYIYDVAQNNNVSICDTVSANGQIYVSISHIVEIQLITASAEDHNFMLQYTVVGCKDLQVSSAMWYKREAGMVTVGCKNTKVSWNLKCEGSQWTGVIGNCTVEADSNGADTSWGLFSDTYTVALIVVISLGVLLFIVTVLCVYCVGKTILQKRSTRQQHVVDCNFYATDSIQRVLGPAARRTPTQSPMAVHRGYMLQPYHVQAAGPPPPPLLPPPPPPASCPSEQTYRHTMGSDELLSNDSCPAERSSEELLPGYSEYSLDDDHGDLHADHDDLHDPQYFILDKDYMDRATLQIR